MCITFLNSRRVFLNQIESHRSPIFSQPRLLIECFFEIPAKKKGFFLGSEFNELPREAIARILGLFSGRFDRTNYQF